MLTIEAKLNPSQSQANSIDEAIRTFQFVRNKALRLWMDTGANPYDLNKYCAVIAKEYGFVNRLNSQARQAAAERVAYAISRYLKADKKGHRLRKPSFQKDNRSVEYKHQAWKLTPGCRRITFTDGIGIGSIPMRGAERISAYEKSQIKRVRIVRRADMYFVQFCINIDRREVLEPTGNSIGLDMGLLDFYTDSEGASISCPKFLRKGEVPLKREQRRLARKQKGSSNRLKAKDRLARRHLKIQRQRKDFAVKLARCVVKSNDFVAVEDLQVKNMIRNPILAKSIQDASWSLFTNWLSYYGSVFGRPVVKVPPQFTSQDCSGCGSRVRKALSDRNHACQNCGLKLGRDENAARNILRLGLELVEKTYRRADENETPVEFAPLYSRFGENVSMNSEAGRTINTHSVK